MSDSPDLRPDIEQAWNRLKDTTSVTRSRDTLGERLDEGETVTRLVGAMHDGRSGLLVLTGRRLFFHSQRRRTAQYFVIPWQSDTPITWNTGWMGNTLKITSDHQTWEFFIANRSDGETFVNTLRTHTFSEPDAVAPQWYASAGFSPEPAHSSTAHAPDRSQGSPLQNDPTRTPDGTTGGPSPHTPEQLSTEAILSSLERLGALYEKGILDEREFASAKAALLAKLGED